MKKILKLDLILFTIILMLFGISSCKENIEKKSTKDEIALAAITTPPKKKKLTNEFKAYWYAGNAEITSYRLEMARYAETRKGTAVLIYVTEPFLADKQVKADESNPSNIPVLKLNSTKKFLTGIYPYSIMTSSFYPVHDNQHAVKISTSVQEWCGHIYAQLNNREEFNITSHSYFENEADQDFELEKTVLENELWNKIRIDPSALPVGGFKAIPSFEYVRLGHKELKAYDVVATLNESDGLSSYELRYPEFDRTLTINFTSTFPYTIESWTDTYKSGFGPNAKTMTTRATKISSLKTPYWKQHNNEHLFLRDSLGL
ncbi:MAG: septum formation inhibitor Maf [Flavobacteriaceae bacterium]|nr:MAG: septum formation inhibitor Maf [Flavobacteriaceae bacterium]